MDAAKTAAAAAAQAGAQLSVAAAAWFSLSD